ncbi:aminoglycoside phosphotransferase family protein [Streptomyces sp. NRRL S-495]|uniref:aminoglycoside phosphotransferase family protein n=1 Tax=Streptomyces sp. NRRL S-495 TaxID=1609133 RepID=UPI0005F89A0B|nr:aminoglycoside phosphotransferase family protein [Streptomyces sp. NRRL S-495]KJY30076.1 hydroxyurea phosphotransferase [Streptomyces sp. NRRL S-495]
MRSVSVVPIQVPEALVASLVECHGADGRVWADGLPALAAASADRWGLRLDGPPAHGVVGLVLPVRRADGSRAVLKLQRVDEETAGEPLALRAWNGRGAVRLLDHDPATGSMLLERLDPARSLLALPDDRAATSALADLTMHQAPSGLRTLAEVADGMLAEVPAARERLAGEADRRLLADLAAALGEVRPEPGDRLLHWDLHYANVLAPTAPDPRAPWLAIDPKPLAGDPGFELLPALSNRWSDLTATGDLPRALRLRFDLLTDRLALDRPRATRWTLARVLQNVLWDIADGESVIDGTHRTIAEALSASRGGPGLTRAGR